MFLGHLNKPALGQNHPIQKLFVKSDNNNNDDDDDRLTEMAQWLGVCTVLAKNWSSAAAPTKSGSLRLHANYRLSGAFLWPQIAPLLVCLCVCVCVRACTHMHVHMSSHGHTRKTTQ